ncbi:hypothetical protein AB1Y20_013136 [Prymnesium parvum]|uniref:BART domain-containing protein n=1 Tax=Prymnesium parvum TaxID=97485 RepID=A0AB34IJR6_PRYPA
MGSAPSQPAAPTDGESRDAPRRREDVLLDVLDHFAHDPLVVDPLVAFFTKHCRRFSDSEQSLECTQLHINYQARFEALLASVLARAGLDELAFDALLRDALARGAAEAELLVSLADAAADYRAFHRTMLACARHAGGAGAREGGEAARREELRAHMWGMGGAVRPRPEGGGGEAARREKDCRGSSAAACNPLGASLDGRSEFLPLPGRVEAACEPRLGGGGEAARATHPTPRGRLPPLLAAAQGEVGGADSDLAAGGRGGGVVAGPCSGTQASAEERRVAGEADAPPAVLGEAVPEEPCCGQPPDERSGTSVAGPKAEESPLSTPSRQAVADEQRFDAQGTTTSRRSDWRPTAFATQRMRSLPDAALRVRQPLSPDGFRSSYDPTAMERRKLLAHLKEVRAMEANEAHPAKTGLDLDAARRKLDEWAQMFNLDRAKAAEATQTAAGNVESHYPADLSRNEDESEDDRLLASLLDSLRNESTCT